MIGQPWSQGPEDCLTLTNPEVRSAFEELFLSGVDDKARAHSILAGEGFASVRTHTHRHAHFTDTVGAIII